MSDKTSKAMQQQLIVKGALFNNGALLLVQRYGEESYLPGVYELPGGKLEENEDISDTLKREIADEIGLNVKVGQMIYSQTEIAKDGDKQYVTLVFRVEPLDPAKVTINLTTTHDAYLWADCSDDLESIKKTKLADKVMRKLCSEASDIFKRTNKSDSQHEEIYIYTDGGSRGNPGPSASGYVLLTTDGQIIEEGGEYLGITTNNQAEYQAVKLALEAAKKYRPKKLKFFIDSLLVVNQLNGLYKIRNRDLWPIHQSIKELTNGYERVTFGHVRREENKLADAKVNEVLDSHEA